MNEVTDKTILLVEDEIFIATMEIQQLEKIGYHLIHADGGLRAIEILKELQGKIGLILMDIDLGEEKDGTEIAAEILKDYDIPILFLSSRIEVETVKKTEVISSYGYVVINSGITVLDASIKMAFKLFEANKKTEIQKEELNMLLYSIGDAVIATDKYGAIIRMNTIAETLTGFLFEEAKGKQLVDVFKIISAITRKVCKNPVELVLASGKIIGLANHTILISKTGEEYQIADSGSPIKDRDGNINGVVLVFRDVTKEYSIQRKIEESEKKFRTLFMQAAVGVAEIDTMTGCFIQVNKRYSEIVGVTEEELLALDFQSITHPDDLELDLTNMQHLKNGEINEFSMEKRYIRKNGTIVWVLLTVSPMWQIGESPTHHIAVVQDITERKLADEKIFNLLKEKEHLLKEIHHRVKNNMHTIYSLLMVQSNSEDDSKAAKILQDAAGRVQSMMVLYDKLYRSQTDDTISIREYLPTLINEITDLFPAKDVIKIETEIDDIFLNSKVLSPLGILVNELITNTMKYAFVNRDSGIIRVTARRKENRISIEFEDNGNGIPESVSFESSKGFGLQLIGLLVKQIGGVISIDRANGTKFTIEFSH